MRNSILLAASAAALAASPALAQVNVGVGGTVGAGVNAGANLPTDRVVGGVRGTVDRAVDRADRTVNNGLGSDVVLATRADVSAGATVRDSRGRRVGTIQSIDADTVLVVRGNRQMRVPLASLYRSGSGLVTSLTRKQLRASANMNASAAAEANAHN